MSTLTDRFVFILVDATVKATMLLALAAIIAICTRRASASFRHLIWALGLGCALCLPLLSQTLPHWRVPIRKPVVQPRQAALSPPPALDPSPEASRTKSKSASISVAPATSSQATEVSSPVHSDPMPSAPAYTAQVPWAAWTLVVWAVGVLLALVRMARAAVRLKAVVAASTHIQEGFMAVVKTTAMKAMQVSRPVVLLIGSKLSRVAVPLTWGARRPIVVLPAEATTWSEDKLRAALLHEMAHMRRCDWLLQTLAYLICALDWFNPLVWLAARKMRAESETSCDDLVLAAGMPAADYARHLLDVALCARDGRCSSLGAVAMAQTPRIEGRLRTVLATGLSRRPPTRRIILGVLVTGLIFAIPLAALRLVAHAQGVAVPAADRLQLQGDFTLRYAVTVTDLRPRQSLFAEYTKMQTQYQELLRNNPRYQPVPEEAQKPFSYFLSRRPKTRHLLLTVSALDGRLLYRSIEGSDTYTWVYDGRSSSLNWNGHTGQTDAGLMFGPDFSLPGVGLPHLPLIKTATLLNAIANQQTWMVESPSMSVGAQGLPTYFPATAHAVKDGETWKLLNIDDGNQRLQYLRHQRFMGLWIAAQMTTTRYSPSFSTSPAFSSLMASNEWIEKHRTATFLHQYRLLSASSMPLALVDFDKPAVERRAIEAAYAAGIRRDILHWPTTWHMAPGSVHYNTQVQRLDVHDHTAQAVVMEDDHAIATDPRTNQRHSLEGSATFNDFWRLIPYGGDVSKDWVLERGRAEGQKMTVDGKAMAVESGQPG